MFTVRLIDAIVILDLAAENKLSNQRQFNIMIISAKSNLVDKPKSTSILFCESKKMFI